MSNEALCAVGRPAHVVGHGCEFFVCLVNIGDVIMYLRWGPVFRGRSVVARMLKTDIEYIGLVRMQGSR